MVEQFQISQLGSGSCSHAGKVFYLELDGEGRHPVFHFGMTGMLQVCACASTRFSSYEKAAVYRKIRGKMPVHYREAPRKASTQWPPRFMKVDSTLSLPPNDPVADLLISSLCTLALPPVIAVKTKKR